MELQFDPKAVSNLKQFQFPIAADVANCVDRQTGYLETRSEIRWKTLS